MESQDWKGLRGGWEGGKIATSRFWLCGDQRVEQSVDVVSCGLLRQGRLVVSRTFRSLLANVRSLGHQHLANLGLNVHGSRADQADAQPLAFGDRKNLGLLVDGECRLVASVVSSILLPPVFSKLRPQIS